MVWITKRVASTFFSPVHVVLVSLLVDQLSGLFLIFFGRPKKKLSSLREFLVSLWEFLVDQKKIWSTKNSQRLTKNSLRLDNSFLVDQEKWEKDRTIGRPIDWPKPHGRDLGRKFCLLQWWVKWIVLYLKKLCVNFYFFEGFAVIRGSR